MRLREFDHRSNNSNSVETFASDQYGNPIDPNHPRYNPNVADRTPIKPTAPKSNRALPKPSQNKELNNKALKKPLEFKPAGENQEMYADWGRKGDEKREWHNLHGWNFQGDQKTADAYKHEIEKLAKDYNVEPRALSYNQIQTLRHAHELQGTNVGGRHSMLGMKGRPYSANIAMPNPEEHIPHEFAHQLSMNIAAVDADGGLRKADRDNVSPTGEGNYITGFGTDDAEDKYLTMANKYIDDDGNLDQAGFRKSLYNNVFDRETNQQRPELKHELASTVSYILSDKSLINDANNNSWLSKGYRYDPEELWARGFEEFSKMKRMNPEERFNDKNIITPETYKQIQKLIDTFKVIKGNTLAKGRRRDTGTRTA